MKLSRWLSAAVAVVVVDGTIGRHCLSVNPILVGQTELSRSDRLCVDRPVPYLADTHVHNVSGGLRPVKTILCFYARCWTIGVLLVTTGFDAMYLPVSVVADS